MTAASPAWAPHATLALVSSGMRAASSPHSSPTSALRSIRMGAMRIDLNADVGEECGDDAALIPLLTSANVACGAHAGDAAVMQRTVELCLKHGVRIGAHVSYPDREHFGRRDMALPPTELEAYALD